MTRERAVIIEHRDACAVEPEFDVRGVHDDAVGIPGRRGTKQRAILVGLAEFFRPPPAVRCDRNATPARRERAATAFLVDVAEIAIAEIDVGLVTLRETI